MGGVSEFIFGQAPGARLRAQAGGIEMAPARRQRVRVAAAVPEVVGQRAAGVDATRLQRPVRQGAQRAAAADIGHLEPDALLRPDAHHDDVAGRLDSHALQRGDRGQPRDHTGGAVEIKVYGAGQLGSQAIVSV